MTPFGVRDKIKNETIPVPCGKCIECKKRRVSSWSFRLMVEAKHSVSAHFITLTYDPKFMTRDTKRITKNGFMTVNKRDIQLFMKRLRKSNKASKLKYYLAAEYGGKTNRPHYHMILFNCDMDTISPAWELGDVHFGTVTPASVGYTLKYISKPSRIPMFKNDDRTPEFSLMSKGLGKDYLSKAMINWHLSDKNNRMYCNLEEGKKIAMPRYYKQKIYDDHQRKQIGFLQRKEMIKRELDAQRKNPDYWRTKVERDKAAIQRYNKRSTQTDKL